MSAAATASPRRWGASGTSSDAIADRLRLMLHELERDDGHRVASRTMNLVIGPSSDGRVADGLAEARRLHPARVIHLHRHADDRLDAEIAIHDHAVPQLGRTLLTEDVVLRADQERLAYAQSLLAPLLARGLPTVAWLPGHRHGAAEDALARTAHVTIYDSDADPEPARALAFAAATAEAHPCRDLAWFRTERWRARISAAFAEPAARARLAADRTAVVVGDPARPSARLLAAWIAARAGLDAAMTDGAGREPVEAVTVAGIAIDCGTGATCGPGALSEALDSVYAPPRGYEAALTALDRVGTAT